MPIVGPMAKKIALIAHGFHIRVYTGTGRHARFSDQEARVKGGTDKHLPPKPQPKELPHLETARAPTQSPSLGSRNPQTRSENDAGHNRRPPGHPGTFLMVFRSTVGPKRPWTVEAKCVYGK
jgi:hypothetical protein